MVLGLILKIFGVLETGLKIVDFQWLSGGPGAEHRWPVDINLVDSSASLQYRNSMETLQHAEYNIKHAAIKGYKKRDANYEYAKN